MQRLTTFLLLLTAMLISTGCSMMAPQYTASLDNVQTLKDIGNYTAKVGGFTSTTSPENANPIKIRGSSLASPYQESYANYLNEAIKQELQLAQKLSPDSTIEISGILLKNDINTSDFSIGFVTIEARFIVKKSGKPMYEQVKSVRHEFPSSFAGAVAIPRAVQEYEFAVRKLLALLYVDPIFSAALK
jgi:hypothetical protein